MILGRVIAQCNIHFFIADFLKTFRELPPALGIVVTGNEIDVIVFTPPMKSPARDVHPIGHIKKNDMTPSVAQCRDRFVLYSREMMSRRGFPHPGQGFGIRAYPASRTEGQLRLFTEHPGVRLPRKVWRTALISAVPPKWSKMSVVQNDTYILGRNPSSQIDWIKSAAVDG